MPFSALYDEIEFDLRLKQLYPSVDESKTPLPKKWNTKDKFKSITLSQDNLRVVYKGEGKTHRDAASVRATYPIPAACGIYYFEVTVISKGRDGYMGIGISAQGVNLNRLPGWDKNSYGYHGDDGHSFCATGTGESYGPTFTTGDVIGCCLNLVDHSCFYTKNGLHIGTAFKNLPNISFFPTVGLQTPNEELCANFGQQPFLFDFEDYLKEWRNSNRATINELTIKDEYGNLQSILHKLVSSYLIHHGYVASTEAFNSSIRLGIEHFEDITSIKNRQKIQKLVLSGRIGEAIETTDQFFPGLLAKNSNLLFLLKIRQFIEMIDGTDSEVRHLTRKSSASSNYNSPVTSPKHPHWNKSASNSPASSHNGFSPPPQRMSNLYQTRSSDQRSAAPVPSGSSPLVNEPSAAEHLQKSMTGSSCSSDCDDMDTDSDGGGNSKADPSNGVISNGLSVHDNREGIQGEEDEDMASTTSSLCGGNQVAIEKLLQFGQQLHNMFFELKPEDQTKKNEKTLREAFSLLAYTDPWNSPVGGQLDPVEREPICAALNSKILESQNLPKRPPLLTMIGQTKLCIQKMLATRIGSAAFVSIYDYLQP